MKGQDQKPGARIQNDIIHSMGQQIEALMKALNESENQKNLLQQQLKFQYEEMEEDKRCYENHLLRYVMSSSILSQPVKTSCVKCKKDVSKSNVCWICLRCKQSHCVQCKGHRRSICPYAHALKEQKEYKTWKFCDICKAKGIKSGWHCDCDFDLCDKCHNPPA